MDENASLDYPLSRRLIPCPSCFAATGTPRNLDQVHLFPLIDCAMSLVQSEVCPCVSCPKCHTQDIPMEQLAPDLLLTDLHSSLKVPADRLTFDPDTDLLGRGAEGSVYRAKFGDYGDVAVKQSIVVQVVRHIKSQSSSRGSDSSGGSDQTTEDSSRTNSSSSSDSSLSVETYLKSRVGHKTV